MRRGRSTMLLLGGVLALLAFFVLYIGLSAAGNPPQEPVGTPTPEPKAQVVVAATDIPAYTVLQEEMFTIKEVALSTILTDTTSSTVNLVGQMTTRDYRQDAQIRLSDVTDPGISQVLAKGQRAFVLPVQEINNFGGQLVDNDSVDLLWTREFETTQMVVGPDGAADSKTATLPSTKTILQNLKVLRVIPLRPGGPAKSGRSAVNSEASLESGTNAERSEQGQAEAAMQMLYNDGFNAQDEPVYSAVAVMAVTDQQAEVIKYAREYGRISLALRARDDTEFEQTTGITDKILIEDYGLVVPELVIK